MLQSLISGSTRTSVLGMPHTNSFVSYCITISNDARFIHRSIINDEEFAEEFEYGPYGFRPVLLSCADGRTYLYVEMLWDNDYKNIYVYDIFADEPDLVDYTELHFAAEGLPKDQEIWGQVIAQITDPESFMMASTFQLLSTLTGKAICYVGEDGFPDSDAEYWTIDSGIYLTLKQRAQFDIVDEEGNIVASVVNVPSGTRLNPVMTDGETYVDLKADNGRIYRVYVDISDGWPQKVNGIELDDLFEGVQFAG